MKMNNHKMKNKIKSFRLIITLMVMVVLISQINLGEDDTDSTEEGGGIDLPWSSDERGDENTKRPETKKNYVIIPQLPSVGQEDVIDTTSTGVLPVGIPLKDTQELTIEEYIGYAYPSVYTSDVEEIVNRFNAEKEEEKRKTREFLSQGLNIPLSFGRAFGAVGELLGPDEWNTGWRSKFPDWFAGLFGIDGFINTFLCDIPTDKNQAATSVFFGADYDFKIGAHIEGYKLAWDDFVSCSDENICHELFNNYTLCHEYFCTDRNSNRLKFQQNIYRITFMFDPSEKVVIEDEFIKFNVIVKKAGGGSDPVDLSSDEGIQNTVKLKAGSSVYQKTGKEPIIIKAQTEYTEVCFDFKNVDSFTPRFRELLAQIDAQDELCNSFVNEGTAGTEVSSLASLFTFYTSDSEGIADEDLPGNSQEDGSSSNGDMRP